MTDGASVRFRTTIEQADGMNATGIVIPNELIEQLGHGKLPPVRVTVNDHTYRSTVAVMAGRAMVGVSAEVRREAGISGGDLVDVELVVDTSPRTVDMPDDFTEAMADAVGARAFFDGLSNSLQRYHIDNINAAKADSTRQRRIDKAVGLFVAGKKR